MNIIEEDRTKITFKETRFENKKRIFDKIDGHLYDTINYIKSNARSSSDKNDVVLEKLNLIRKQLDEYLRTFTTPNVNSGSWNRESMSIEERRETESISASNNQNFSFNKENKDSASRAQENIFVQQNSQLDPYNSGVIGGSTAFNNRQSQNPSATIKNNNFLQQSQKFNQTLGSRFEFSNQNLGSSFNNFSSLYNRNSLHEDLKL